MNLYQGTQLYRRQPAAPCSSAATCPLPNGFQGHLLQAARHRAMTSCRSSVQPQVWETQDTQQTYAAPAWHPRLFGAQQSKAQQLQRMVEKYYDDVWNQGNDCLDEIAAPGVVYADVFADVEDSFGRSALRGIIRDFQSGHPLLRYQLEDVIIDEERDTVVAHYTATAAHLLPSRDGVVATGCVSTVQGMDKFRFNRFGHCSSIESYRQRFADEEEQLQTIDWDSS